MFIINLSYKVQLEKIDQHLNDHINFLNEQYALGNFIASGRKVPRTGGIIIANVETQSELDEIIKKDPFNSNDLADYAVIEFIISKTCDALKFL